MGLVVTVRWWVEGVQVMSSYGILQKTLFMKDTMTTFVRLVLVSLLLLVDASSADAQTDADALGIGSAAAPSASVTSVPQAAPKYEDASIGFEFEYKVDNAGVCVAWPERLQDAGCDGLEYHSLVAYGVANGPLIRSLAYLRFENNHTATISVVHTTTTKTFISQVEIDDLLDGFLVGLKRTVPAKFTMSGSESGSRYDVMEINGVDALRFEATADAPRGTLAYARSRAIGYVLLGKHGQVMITAATDPQHIRQTRVTLESIVKTVRLPPLAQKGFGRTSWWVRWFDSEFGLFLLVLVVAGLLSVQSYFAQKKRKERSLQR